MNLQELEKKYEELGKEIERLKKQEAQDCIYLLSIEEYQKYKEIIPKFNCWWWLRSAGSGQNYAAHVFSGVSISHNGVSVDDDYGCVRPALNPSKLKSSGLNLHHTFFMDTTTLFHCGITWKKIDADLFISEVPIATHRFDATSNDYQTSEIRQFLLDWYEERKNW